MNDENQTAVVNDAAPEPVREDRPVKESKPAGKRFTLWMLLPIFALAAGLVCLAYTAGLSVTDSKQPLSLFACDFVGLKNFSSFINSPYFLRTACNTLVQNGLLLAVSMLLASLMTALIGRGKKPGRILTRAALCLVPACVPYMFTAYLLYALVPAYLKLAGISGYYLPAAAMLLQQTALLTFCGGLFAYLGKRGIGRGAGEGLCIGLLLCLMRLLTSEMDGLYSLQTATNRQYSETLDSYAFSMGFVNLRYGYAASISVLKLAAQALLAILPAALLSQKAKEDETRLEIADAGREHFLFGAGAFKWIAVLIACVAAVFVLMGRRNLQAYTADSVLTGVNQNLIYLPRSATYALTGGLLSAVVWTAVLSFYKPGRRGFGLFAVLMSMLGGILTVGGFMVAGELNLYNTPFPVILRQVFSSRTVMIVLLLATVFRMAPERNEKAVFLMLLFTGMAFAWGDMFSPFVYIRSSYLWPLSLYARNALMSGMSVPVSQTGISNDLMARAMTANVLKAVAGLMYALPPVVFGIFSAGACIRAFGKKE